ncbi:unnamed protein product, partial [marine sediment metagenome]
INLVEQGPEWGHEYINDRELCQSSESFTTKAFLNEFDAPAWDVHELFAAGPKRDCGQEHKTAGDTECDCRAVAVQQNGHEEIRKKRAQVDGKVEPAIYLGHQALIGFPKLVTNVG